MVKIFIHLCFICGVLTSVNAQDNPLDFYGDVMLNATEDSHRAFAVEKFNSLLKERLSKPNSFKDDLSEIQWMSIKYPSDSSFRLISYQVQLGKNDFAAFGYIQKEDGTVIELKRADEELDDDLEYMQLDQDTWLGGLYYNMMEFEHQGKTKYLLFGYDGYKEFDNRKFVDVLSEINGNKVVFGEEIFVKEVEGERPEKTQRLIIKFSADSNVRLNFDDGLNMIVHPHLIARMGTMPGQGATYISDGSLVGYKYENEIWSYVDRIYDQVSKEAPRPHPVLNEGSKKNIFGKSDEGKEKKKRKKNK